MKFLLALCFVLVVSNLAASASEVVETPGEPVQFNGRFVGEFLDDGRRVRLLEPYTYVDPAGAVWDVPADAIVDGASIPRVFWSVIGGPFEGKYRNASVVHDYYCDSRSRPWEQVHRMFFDAMLESGVEMPRAKVMYYAVYFFGPRWETVETSVVTLTCAGDGDCLPAIERQETLIDLPPETYDAAAVEADITQILESDPSLEEIEALMIAD